MTIKMLNKFLKVSITTLMLTPSFSIDTNTGELTLESDVTFQSKFKDFTLETPRGIFSFREIFIDPLFLEETDKVKLTELANEWEALQSMFGTIIGGLLKTTFSVSSVFNYNLPYEILLKEREKIKSKNPHYKDTFWMIEDQNDDEHFMGFLQLMNVPTHAPRQIYQHLNAARGDLLEIGGGMLKDYRRQGVATNCAKPFINKLASYNDFKGKWLYFATMPDNKIVCDLAHKFGFEDLGIYEVPLGFEILFWEPTMKLSHFVYKIEEVEIRYIPVVDNSLNIRNGYISINAFST